MEDGMKKKKEEKYNPFGFPNALVTMRHNGPTQCAFLLRTGSSFNGKDQRPWILLNVIHTHTSLLAKLADMREKNGPESSRHACDAAG
jgi:hypothetical protein